MAAAPTSDAAPTVRIPSERGIPLNPRFTGEIFDPPQPLIPELAEAAAPLAKTPTAGGYAIDRFVLPEIDIPPACLVNEGDFFPFNLEPTPGGGLPHDPVCVTKNIPKELLESVGDKPYVFSPLLKDESNANANVKPEVDEITKLNQRLDADLTKILSDMKLGAGVADTVAEVAQLQEMQDEVKAAAQEAAKGSKVPSGAPMPKRRQSLSKSPRPAGSRVGVSPSVRVGGSPSAGRGGAGAATVRPNSKGPVPRSGSKGRGQGLAPGQGAARPTPPPPNPKPAPKKSAPAK